VKLRGSASCDVCFKRNAKTESLAMEFMQHGHHTLFEVATSKDGGQNGLHLIGERFCIASNSCAHHMTLTNRKFRSLCTSITVWGDWTGKHSLMKLEKVKGRKKTRPSATGRSAISLYSDASVMSAASGALVHWPAPMLPCPLVTHDGSASFFFLSFLPLAMILR